MKEILMYKQPAGNWKEALPLGNGRLGAMDFGGAWRETLQLDESTYWSGGGGVGGGLLVGRSQ